MSRSDRPASSIPHAGPALHRSGGSRRRKGLAHVAYSKRVRSVAVLTAEASGSRPRARIQLLSGVPWPRTAQWDKTPRILAPEQPHTSRGRLPSEKEWSRSAYAAIGLVAYAVRSMGWRRGVCAKGRGTGPSTSDSLGARAAAAARPSAWRTARRALLASG